MLTTPLLLLERATGIEPVALCLEIRWVGSAARLPRSQIRARHLSMPNRTPDALLGHLPETVPSI